MTNTSRDIDKIMREKLEGFEKTPPAFVWDNIQGKLSSNTRKTRLLYWRIAGVAAALAIAFTAGWQINRNLLLPTDTVVTNKQSNSESILKEKSIVSKNIIIPESIHPITEKTTNETTIQYSLQATTNRIEPSNQLKQIEPRPIEDLTMIESLPAFLTFFVNDGRKLGKSNIHKNIIISPEDQRKMEENSTFLALNKTKSTDSNWMIGAAVSPNYSIIQTSQSAEYLKSMANSRTTDNLNLTGGFSIEYKTKKRWSIQSGVYYNKLEQLSGNSLSSKYSFAYGAESLNNLFNTPVFANNGLMAMNSVAGVIQIVNLPSNVRIEGNLDHAQLGKNTLVTNVDFNQKFEYLEIPLYFRYLLIDSKIDINVLSGVSTNILVGNNVYMLDDNGKNKIGSTIGMTNFNYSGILGIGFNYALTSRMYLNIEPRFKYYFNSLNENHDISYQPYTFGVYSGISYAF